MKIIICWQERFAPLEILWFLFFLIFFSPFPYFFTYFLQKITVFDHSESQVLQGNRHVSPFFHSYVITKSMFLADVLTQKHDYLDVEKRILEGHRPFLLCIEH